MSKCKTVELVDQLHTHMTQHAQEYLHCACPESWSWRNKVHAVSWNTLALPRGTLHIAQHLPWILAQWLPWFLAHLIFWLSSLQNTYSRSLHHVRYPGSLDIGQNISRVFLPLALTQYMFWIPALSLQYPESMQMHCTWWVYCVWYVYCIVMWGAGSLRQWQRNIHGDQLRPRRPPSNFYNAPKQSRVKMCTLCNTSMFARGHPSLTMKRGSQW